MTPLMVEAVAQETRTDLPEGSFMSFERINRVRGLVRHAKAQINSSDMREAEQNISGCRDQIRTVNETLSQVELALQKIPRIDVALLGPSRHGKSTLINSIAGVDLLPTSDIKPCTASIVRLQWAESWSAEIQFVSKKLLMEEWTDAVKDAIDYLRRFEKGESNAEPPDNPRYLLDLLQRFTELFRIDSNCDPRTLVERVRGAKIPKSQAKLLGNLATSKLNGFSELKSLAERYLSTKDVLWTIVDDCTFRGPFPGWHERLGIVDLPGTNDTNAHRSNLTNSLREKANAVAIVTRDSNLGMDIQSWLSNSSVLRDFIEASDSRRQHLFIIRTQLDSYQPEVESVGASPDEEQSGKRGLVQFVASSCYFRGCAAAIRALISRIWA